VVTSPILKPIFTICENIFNLGEVILIKILKNDIMLGDFTIIMAKGETFKKDIIAEILTRQLG